MAVSPVRMRMVIHDDNILDGVLLVVAGASERGRGASLPG